VTLVDRLFKELVHSGRYEEAVLLAERGLLDGWVYRADCAGMLPLSVLRSSPLLLLEEGDLCMRKGRLIEAKEAYVLAIKGFAAQTYRAKMLLAMARVAEVSLRIGDVSSAQTLFSFLDMDLADAGDQDVHGDVLLVLGKWKGIHQLTDDAGKLFEKAMDVYESEGMTELICAAGIDLLIGARWGFINQSSEVDQCVARAGRWAQTQPRLGAYAELAELLSDRGSTFPESSREGLHYFHSAILDVLRMRRKGSTADAWQSVIHNYTEDLLLRLLRYIDQEEFNESPATKQEEEWLAASFPMPSFQSSLERKRNSKTKNNEEAIDRLPSESMIHRWHIRLFGGLAFSQGTKRNEELIWKRKKARELFIYLLFQPNYSSPKDQLMDLFWRDEQPEKAANSLYVCIHELKRTLARQLGMENGVFLKDGSLRLNEELVEFVDVERYLALLRVADQLWTQDAGIAREMYREACFIYDDLLPEIVGSEWLDTQRDYLLEKQTVTLRRLGIDAETREEPEEAEGYYLEWIRRRPYQEEAYQHLIRMYAGKGRRQEAKRWYDKWVKLCRDELSTSPSEETNRYIQE
jgi:DNA-binding SARP family transcriptional activator